MGFEVFDRPHAGRSTAPTVTLLRRGDISVSPAAHALIGSPEAVRLLFDPEARIIGLEPVLPTAQDAFPLRAAGRGRLVAGRVFTRHYDIKTDVSRRYPVELRDGVLCVDTAHEGVAVTSNRAAKD